MDRTKEYYVELAEAACSYLREIEVIRLDKDGGEYYWVDSGEYLVEPNVGNGYL